MRVVAHEDGVDFKKGAPRAKGFCDELDGACDETV
jgi:hypothetical protein